MPEPATNKFNVVIFAPAETREETKQNKNRVLAGRDLEQACEDFREKFTQAISVDDRIIEKSDIFCVELVFDANMIKFHELLFNQSRDKIAPLARKCGFSLKYSKPDSTGDLYYIGVYLTKLPYAMLGDKRKKEKMKKATPTLDDRISATLSSYDPATQLDALVAALKQDFIDFKALTTGRPSKAELEVRRRLEQRKLATRRYREKLGSEQNAQRRSLKDLPAEDRLALERAERTENQRQRRASNPAEPKAP